MMRRIFLSRRNVAPHAAGAGSIAGIVAGWATEGIAYPTNMVLSFGAAILVGGLVAVLLLRAIRAAEG